MASYLISYDLRKPDHDYSNLYAALSAYKAIRGLQSVWLLDSNQPSVGVRDTLMSHMHKIDGLIVIEIGQNWGTHNVLNNAADWLRLRRP